MARKLTFRQLQVSVLAVWYDLNLKEIGTGAGIAQKSVSRYLRSGELSEEVFQRLLRAMKCPPAAVQSVTACLEALDAQEKAVDLSEEELGMIEEAARGSFRLTREILTDAARRSRSGPSAAGYPQPSGLFLARRRAEELWGRLKELGAEKRLAVVRVAEEFQTWALCERVCEESTRAASRNVEEAGSLARLAREIADRVRGPEGWRHSIQGYAAAHGANPLRVAGELKAADCAFAEAKRLLRSGADPAGVLDPGRVLGLEASLRRDQRRFDEALALLDEAAAVGRRPERALIKKGFTLEVMGEYERAVETLLQAAPLVDRLGDPRLWYNQRFNLAVNYTHLSRCADALELARQVREQAVDLGDEIFLIRVTWLEGRIAAGLGRPEEALRLLEEARRRFATKKMPYDVALASLEEAVLLLDQGRVAEVKALAQGLTQVFDSKGVHREALATLKLFQEATEREEATAGLARSVLSYLFHTRYDPGLPFAAS